MFSFLAAESVKITAKMVYDHSGKPSRYQHPLHFIAEIYIYLWQIVLTLESRGEPWSPTLAFDVLKSEAEAFVKSRVDQELPHSGFHDWMLKHSFKDKSEYFVPKEYQLNDRTKYLCIGEHTHRSNSFTGVKFGLNEAGQFIFAIYDYSSVHYIFEVNSFEDLESVFSSHKLVEYGDPRYGLQLDVSTIPVAPKPEEIKQAIDLFASTTLNAPNNLPLECIVEQYISFAERDGYVIRHDRMKHQIVIGEKIVIRYKHPPIGEQQLLTPSDDAKISSICIGTNFSYGLNLFNMKEVKNFFTTILGESK